MAFVEDLSAFFADFGVDATLDGVAVQAIVDTQTVDEFGALTQQPSALLTTAQASAAAPGQAFVAADVTYTVRQVLREPPDGALTRLLLVRS